MEALTYTYTRTWYRGDEGPAQYCWMGRLSARWETRPPPPRTALTTLVPASPEAGTVHYAQATYPKSARRVRRRLCRLLPRPARCTTRTRHPPARQRLDRVRFLSLCLCARPCPCPRPLQLLTDFLRAPPCPQPIPIPFPASADAAPLCLQVYFDPTRTPNWSPALPTSSATTINSETQSQSCVGGDASTPPPSQEPLRVRPLFLPSVISVIKQSATSTCL